MKGDNDSFFTGFKLLESLQERDHEIHIYQAYPRTLHHEDCSGSILDTSQYKKMPSNIQTEYPDNYMNYIQHKNIRVCITSLVTQIEGKSCGKKKIV